MTKGISTFPLSKLHYAWGEHVIDKASGLEVFHAETAHSLIQAAGYLKHTRAISHRKGVFFRGQTKLYPTISPTFLRGTRDGPGNVRLRKVLDVFLNKIRTDKKALRAVSDYTQEALLQHYGIKTTWIDVVDNIWVALWFACHHAKSVVRGQEEYLHFEKRIPHQNSKAAEPDYAYILLVESAYFEPVVGQPGHYKDNRSETIDLRIAAPSQFVRPHAQHGVLVRQLSKAGLPVSNFKSLHAGTIRVNLSSALDWMGSGATLTCHAIFPPAYYDHGYRELLEFVRPSDKELGFIHRIQA